MVGHGMYMVGALVSNLHEVCVQIFISQTCVSICLQQKNSCVWTSAITIKQDKKDVGFDKENNQ